MRGTLAVRLGFAALAAALAARARPAAAQTQFVDGTVATTAGSPIAGITVAAYTLAGAPSSTTTSDSLGRYRLALVTGSYRLLAYDLSGVWATNFYSAATSFETSAQIDLTAPLTGINFAMVRGVSVSGRVTSTSGGGLAGMTVAAYNADGTRRGFEKTNATGAYAILLPPGTYRLASYDDNLGYATSFWANQSSYDAATPVALQSAPVSGVDFSLAPAGRAFGSATDRTTRLAIPGVTVGAWSLAGVAIGSATTGSNGRFSMALLPGDVKFTAYDAGGAYAVSFFPDAPTFAAAPSFRVVAGQATTGIDFFLGPVVPPGTPTTLFVPAAVNTPGANGTYFQTDLWITNPSDTGMTVTVTYLPSGQDNASQTGTPFAVPAHAQLAFPNVVQSLTGTRGAGALKLSASSLFLATSRTYNAATPPGTFGVGVAGRPLAASLSRGVLSGLANNAAYRSNVAVMNPQPIPVTVAFELHRADGTLLGQGTRTLAPLDWFQASTIFSFLGVSSVEDNAWVLVSSPNGSVFSYASVVDQTTGDGTVIEAAAY